VDDYNKRVELSDQLVGEYYQLGIKHAKTSKLRQLLLASVYKKLRGELKAKMTRERLIQLEAQSLAGANMWMESRRMEDELGIGASWERSENMPPQVGERCCKDTHWETRDLRYQENHGRRAGMRTGGQKRQYMQGKNQQQP
jgi:hypothetical protein